MLSNYMHISTGWLARERTSCSADISNPAARRAAQIWCHIFDPNFARLFRHNCRQIAPGVSRDNQPSQAWLVHYKNLRVRKVINLRSSPQHTLSMFETESCQVLSLTLINRPLVADRAAPAEVILEIFQNLWKIKNPVVFHGKSGTTRTGLITTAYMMVFQAVSVASAKSQISTFSVGIAFGTCNIYQCILDGYQSRHFHAAIGFEDWVANEYDKEKRQAGFDSNRPRRELA
jgi:hypothetical protein